MFELDSLKINVLREINSLLGLTNRRSKDENVTQIMSHLIDVYNYHGPFTEQLIRERIEKGISITREENSNSNLNSSSTPEGDLNAFANSDRLNSTLVTSGIVNENELCSDSTLERLETAIVNGIVKTNQIVSTSSDSENSEEEENPDPAIRYETEEESEDEIEEESEDENQYNNYEYSDDE